MNNNKLDKFILKFVYFNHIKNNRYNSLKYSRGIYSFEYVFIDIQNIVVYFYKNMLLHSINGFPAVIRFIGNKKTSEVYYYKGFISRKCDKSSKIIYEDENIFKECFYSKGKLYRKGNNPIKIFYYPNGTIFKKIYNNEN